MKIGVAGSVGLDHLMTFTGKFSDSFVAGSMEKISLSFLVDSLDVRRGGCAANISFGLGLLGLNPILIAAVGKDWPDYESWLSVQYPTQSAIQSRKPCRQPKSRESFRHDQCAQKANEQTIVQFQLLDYATNVPAYIQLSLIPQF